MYFTKKRERERKKRKGKFAIIIILTFELAFPRFQSRNKDEKVSRPERAMSGINGSCGKLYIHNRCKEVFWPCLTSTFNYVIKYTGYVHRIYESLNRLIIASILLSLSVLLFYLAILDRNLHHLFQKNGTRCWTKSLIIHELYRYLVDSVCSSKKRERERQKRGRKEKKREKNWKGTERAVEHLVVPRGGEKRCRWPVDLGNQPRTESSPRFPSRPRANHPPLSLYRDRNL